MRLVIVALVLAGCAPNHPAIAARSSNAVLCSVQADYGMPAEARNAATQELRRRYQPCDSELVAAGRAERARDAAFNRALIETGAAIIQANQPPPPPRQINCYTTYVGNRAYTTCQ